MLLAILLAAAAPLAQATPAPAPSPTPSGPPPEFMAAAQAFSGCLRSHLSAVPAGVAPATGAQQVIAGCTTQRGALDAQFEKMIGGPAVPAASRDAARAQYQGQMAQLPTQLAGALQQRAAATAPTPGATPTPGR